MSSQCCAPLRTSIQKSLRLLCFLFVSLNAHSNSMLQIKQNADPEMNTVWNATMAAWLKRDLLLNYDRSTRPSQSGEATTVQYGLKINHVELDEEESIFQIYCSVSMKWTDHKLKWNEEDYGGLTHIYLPDHEIWQPDIWIDNGADRKSMYQYGSTECIVNNQGAVLRVSPADLKVFCEIDLTNWPFDTQMCTIKVISWTHHGWLIDLRNFSETELTNIVPNAKWRLMSIKAQRNEIYYYCCDEPFVDLMLNVTIARQSTTYKTLVVTPIAVIVLMNLATFWLPTTSSDKIYLGGITVLVITLFLICFAHMFPSGNTPLIVYFYSGSFSLIGFSIVISVVVINLSNGSRSRPVPWRIKSLLTGWLGRLILLQNMAQQASGMQLSMDDAADFGGYAKAIQREWRVVAEAVDRIAFLFYCFMFICFAIAYSV